MDFVAVEIVVVVGGRSGAGLLLTRGYCSPFSPSWGLVFFIIFEMRCRKDGRRDLSSKRSILWEGGTSPPTLPGLVTIAPTEGCIFSLSNSQSNLSAQSAKHPNLQQNAHFQEEVL